MNWNLSSTTELQRLHRWSYGINRKNPTLYNGCNYVSILGLKSIHVSKRGPRKHEYIFVSYIILPHCNDECCLNLYDSSYEARSRAYPNSKVNGVNMGPTWVLSAPDGPHVGPMNPCYQGKATDELEQATRAPATMVLTINNLIQSQGGGGGYFSHLF